MTLAAEERPAAAPELPKAALGNTGLKVTRLGIGLQHIGEIEYRKARAVLDAVLEHGINFLDTAACYGRSEEYIGRAISGSRSEYVLATKAGHVPDGETGEPWTYDTIMSSIERSLARMRTDHLDLVQLHSCKVDVLKKGDALRALQDARRAGKTRFIGYSGDNEAAALAVESGAFDTLQTSFSLVEQHALRGKVLEKADARGMGIIAKRPVANFAWSARTRPNKKEGEYFDRAKKMGLPNGLDGAPDDPFVTAVGFVLGVPLIDVAIVGTTNPDHLASNVSAVIEQLPLDGDVVDDIKRRYAEADEGWKQIT